MIRLKTLSLSQLEGDVRAFLDSPNPSMARIRKEISGRLLELGRVYVIGGLIRDLAMYEPNKRPISDLDLVVRCNNAKLRQFAEEIQAIPNRFGGYAVKTDSYRVDFWAFSKTWAKKAGYVKVSSPKDLVKTTFFDWDAVVYGLSEDRLWAIDGYLDRLNSGVLDINLKENPSRLGTLVRALRRLMMWDAKPSPRLRAFILDEIQHFKWQAIVSAERMAFQTVYLSEFRNRVQYLDAVLLRSTFANRSMDRMRDRMFTEIEVAPRAVEPVKRLGNLSITRVNKVKPAKRKRAAFKDLFAS